MENELKILFVEDVPADVEFAKRILDKEGIKFQSRIVENEIDFIRELEQFVPDIIISDYRMPHFNGMRALKISLEKCPNTPFILLTGSLNEETAVECIKSGASDYLIKEQITRLPFAVKEALKKTEIRLEKEKVEQTLKESEEKYRVIVDNIPSVVLIHTEKEILFANPTAVKVFGADSIEQILKMDIADFIYPEDKEDFLNRKKQVYPIGITSNFIERKLVKFNGEIIFTETISVPIQYFGRDAIQTIIRDISDRKRTEEKLRTLIRAVEQNPVSIVITNANGSIEYVNPKFTEVTGYSCEEIIGKNPNILKSGNKPKEEYEALWDTILSGKTWYGEFYNKKKNGESYWVSASISPIVNNQGDITHFVGVKEDITEKKKMISELIEAKERAEESDKLKSEFLAQMSHEIRTPLSAIVGNVDFLNGCFDKKMNSDARSCFDAIDLASQRIIRTIDLILNTAELQTCGYKPQLVKVDLNSEILNKLYKEYQLSAKQKGIEMIYICREKDTKVIADTYSITQIFSNLINNAIKYTKKGKVKILLERNKTGNITIEIKDTGIGISKEFLQKIFEPFSQEEQGYTRSFDGNGLGLALIKKYCEINNAIMEVETEKNVGSTFRIIFDEKFS